MGDGSATRTILINIPMAPTPYVSRESLIKTRFRANRLSYI